MNPVEIKIRLMQDTDFDSVVRIDERVLSAARPEYYELKFERLFQTGEFVPTSLVAQTDDGMVVGFIMGELYIGEYGISNEGAAVDTVGVDPDFRKLGIGRRLIDEFVDHLRQLGVRKINTLVDTTDEGLMRYFENCGFSPSRTVINLERSI